MHLSSIFKLTRTFSCLLLIRCLKLGAYAYPEPLSSLTPQEISLTSSVIKQSQVGSSDVIFVTIRRVEPRKGILAPYLKAKLFEKETSGNSIPRKSETILIVSASYKSYRIIVDLKTKKLESIKSLGRGVQPMINLADSKAATNAITNNQTVMDRFDKLGLKLDLIRIQTSACGYYNDPIYANRRVVESYFYFSMFQNDNKYAHPLDFVVFTDVKSEEIIRITDIPIYFKKTGAPLKRSSLPRETSNYSPLARPKFIYRKPILPVVTTPSGLPGFQVNLKRSQVKWDKFTFRYSFDPKEGLVLHDISYDKRSLIYRASLSEMFVPYMDPRNPYQHKHPLDEGEFGLGLDANVLLPNSECYPTGQLIDVYVNNENGEAKLIPGAICIHEEDGGLLHTHMVSDPKEIVTTARARVLVIFFVATVGNYDYAFHWKFHQDGTIGMEVGMTGLLATSLTLDGKTPYGTRVLPKVNALFHQHIFNVRLDTAFDGEINSVVIQDKIPVPDNLNPYGQGIQTKVTQLTTSMNSVTDIDASKARVWIISNPNSMNPKTNKPVSWKLQPLNKPLLLAKPYARAYKRGAFAAHSMWVTTYKDGEFNAAGDYPNQSPGGAGLPKYVSRNDSIVATDIVVWYTFGATHIPRPEDFPIMPYEKLGFMLKPVNFFSSYPGLDIPPDKEFS